MSDDEELQMRKRQAEAMAKTQAWGLAAHQCATRHGHPNSDRELSSQTIGLKARGADEPVLVAAADLLGEELGHQRAITVISEVLQQRPGVDLIFLVAAALASAIDWDGARALTEHQRCHDEAQFCGVVADALKAQREEGGDPPQPL